MAMGLILTQRWDLEEALGLVRAVQPQTRQFGFHLCLGGGVLNRGWSDKDLDLYFLPMNGGGAPDAPERVEKLLAWMESLWGKWEKLGGDAYPDFEYDLPYVAKVKFDYDGLRIDAFVLGAKERKVEKKLRGEDIWDIWDFNGDVTEPTPAPAGGWDVVGNGNFEVRGTGTPGVLGGPEPFTLGGTIGGIQRAENPWRAFTTTTTGVAEQWITLADPEEQMEQTQTWDPPGPPAEPDDRIVNQIERFWEAIRG